MNILYNTMGNIHIIQTLLYMALFNFYLYRLSPSVEHHLLLVVKQGYRSYY